MCGRSDLAVHLKRKAEAEPYEPPSLLRSRQRRGREARGGKRGDEDDGPPHSRLSPVLVAQGARKYAAGEFRWLSSQAGRRSRRSRGGEIARPVESLSTTVSVNRVAASIGGVSPSCLKTAAPKSSDERRPGATSQREKSRVRRERLVSLPSNASAVALSVSLSAQRTCRGHEALCA